MNLSEIKFWILIVIYAFAALYWYAIFITLKKRENERVQNAQIQKETNAFLASYEKLKQNGGGTISISNSELIREDVLIEHMRISQNDNISIRVIASSVGYSNIPNDR